jgi:hypothetical protein
VLVCGLPRRYFTMIGSNYFFRIGLVIKSTIPCSNAFFLSSSPLNPLHAIIKGSYMQRMSALVWFRYIELIYLATWYPFFTGMLISMKMI